MKVYGPYTRKDGRKIVILYEDGKRKTVSYPKFLVETQLGIKLKDNETIDHIDCNINNDNFSNLRIVIRSEHVKDDVIRRKPQQVICNECGKTFISNMRNRNRAAGPFCSKKCTGTYGQKVQVDREKKIEPYKPTVTYYKLKNTKQFEPIIGNNNGGLRDIGEPLTGNTEGT